MSTNHIGCGQFQSVNMKPNVKTTKDITHDTNREGMLITVPLDWLIVNNNSKIETNITRN